MGYGLWAMGYGLWAMGYGRTPGIATDEQVATWKSVTDAVHARGGRISHPSMLPMGDIIATHLHSVKSLM